MNVGPTATRISGNRLHLHHGPIDLIIGVDGPEREVCFEAAATRFETVLTSLVAELPALRSPIGSQVALFGPVAKRMAAAVAPHGTEFVTPMAAVAGAVADEVLAAMLKDNHSAKAYVNNGGDIALHLAGTARFKVLGPGGEIVLQAADRPRGIATSGWRGRSHSLGIADAVTVLAQTAAAADVAATLIANTVNLPNHPAITREPAKTLCPDSDLGARLVTTSVGPLAEPDIARALDAGCCLADQFVKRGLIESAVLSLQGQIATSHNTAAVGAANHA